MGRRFEPDGAYKTRTPLAGVFFLYPPGENRVRWAHVAGATHRVAGCDGDRQGIRKTFTPCCCPPLRLIQNQCKDIAEDEFVDVDEFPCDCSSGTKVFASPSNHNIRVAWASYGYFTQRNFAAAQPGQG